MVKVRESDAIQGVYFVEPESFEDDRGRFTEIFRREWIPNAREMLQVNRSESRAGVLRGMHYHLFQADFWYLTAGRAFVALFDFRAASKTPEALQTFEVSAADNLGIYIPPGVAHGFFSLEDATLLYMVDQYFDGTDELGIYFADPSLGIEWPDAEPIVSERDASCQLLADIEEENLPF